MLNTFVLKKYSTFLFIGLLNPILWYIGLQFGMLWGFVLLSVGLLLSVVIGKMLLKNPFTEMLEGKGILALNIDSTGVIRPFIVGILPPYIRGKLGKEKVDDIFNRSTVLNLAAPVTSKTLAKPITEGEKKGGITITLDEEEYNKGRFALFHYPVVIYNQQIKSVLTKDFLSGLEKDVFAEHTVLYLNKKLEELTGVVRDFGRYVVELTKPKGSFLKSKWFFIIMIIALVIIAIMFAPKVIQLITGMMGNAGDAVNSAGGAITPRG